ATPLSYLTDFLDIAAGGADVVIGSREGSGARRIGEPWYRHVMGRVFNRMVQLLVLPGIEDTQCGFKLFRRDSMHAILDRALLYQGTEAVAGPRVTAFDVELLVIARFLGLKVVSEPVVWTYGTNSKVNPVRDTLHNASDILRVKSNVVFKRYRS
ncbi:MAG: glycosyltransferase family 2 protein, partial [Verrucomicrobiales bacterium]